MYNTESLMFTLKSMCVCVHLLCLYYEEEEEIDEEQHGNGVVLC